MIYLEAFPYIMYMFVLVAMYVAICYRQTSLSLGITLFGGPLFTGLSIFVGSTLYFQIYAISLWSLIFIIKDRNRIYNHILRVKQHKIYLALLILLFLMIGMQVDLNYFHIIVPGVFNGVSIYADINEHVHYYYYEFLVRTVFISIVIILALNTKAEIIRFFVGIAVVTIITGFIVLFIQFDKVMYMCENNGYVGFQIDNFVNRSDLSYKMSLSFSVLYVLLRQYLQSYVYSMLFLFISLSMLLLSGGKAGVLLFLLSISIIMFKLRETKKLFVFIIVYPLILVSMQNLGACKTYTYIMQNISRASDGLLVRKNLFLTSGLFFEQNDASNNNTITNNISDTNNFISDINIYGGKANNSSGTHNFFVDLYNNFTLYQFIIILAVLSYFILSAYKQSKLAEGDRGKSISMIFILLILSSFVNFNISSYLSRNIFFPVLISVAFAVIVNLNNRFLNRNLDSTNNGNISRLEN